MKSNYFAILLIATFWLTGCSTEDSLEDLVTEIEKEIETAIPEIPNPTTNADVNGDLVLAVSDITETSAAVSWSGLVAKDDIQIFYDVRLGSKMIAENLTTTSFELKDLESNSTNIISVLASANGIQADSNTTNFKTLGFLPSEFNVTSESLDCESIKISWDKPTTGDNASLTYDLYLDNDLYEKNYSDTTITLSVNNDEFYTFEVIAKGTNDASRSVTTEFRIEECEAPSDFSIFVDSVTASQINLSWESATLSNGSPVTYDILVNGNFLTSTTRTLIQLNDLDSETKYTITINAKAASGATNSVTKFVETLEQVETVHPTISIVRANLFKKGSGSFQKQALIELSVDPFELDNLEILLADSVAIQNFTTSGNSIVSGTLNDTQYAIVDANRKGHISFIDAGVKYQLSFDIVLK